MARLTIDELYSVIVKEELEGKFSKISAGETVLDTELILEIVEDAENEILFYITEFSSPVTDREKVWIKDLFVHRARRRFSELEDADREWYGRFTARLKKVSDEKNALKGGTYNAPQNGRDFTRETLGNF